MSSCAKKYFSQFVFNLNLLRHEYYELFDAQGSKGKLNIVVIAIEYFLNLTLLSERFQIKFGEEKSGSGSNCY